MVIKGIDQISWWILLIFAWFNHWIQISLQRANAHVLRVSNNYFFNVYSVLEMSTGAEQLRDEADKLESSKGGFFSKLFGGGDSKLEEACDLYTRAGSRFKGMIIFVFILAIW